jgi:hypothetical protein
MPDRLLHSGNLRTQTRHPATGTVAKWLTISETTAAIDVSAK